MIDISGVATINRSGDLIKDPAYTRYNTDAFGFSNEVVAPCVTMALYIQNMVAGRAMTSLNQQIIINAIQKAGVVTVTDEEVEKAVEGRITDKTDEETAKRIREEAKDNLAFSKVPDYLIENNTFKLSGDPITPDEYMEDYYKRMSEEQAASEDAKEE